MYHAARDVNLRVEEVKKQHPNLKCIIHGHSMGGLIQGWKLRKYALEFYPEFYFKWRISILKFSILRIIYIVISNPELISTLMVKENPKCIDGLILEAPAFKLHEATAKWYIILGTNIR